MDYCEKSQYFELLKVISLKRAPWTNVLEHKHDFFELGYVLEGEATNTVNSKSSTIKKGNYFILDRTSVHSYKKAHSENLLILNCLFLPELIDSTLTECSTISQLLDNYLIKIDASTLETPVDQYVFTDSNGKIYELLMSIKKELDLGLLSCMEIIRSYLLQIIILSVRNLTNMKKNYSQITNKIMSYIHTNFQNPYISLSDCCNKLFYSIPYISKKFKIETKMTYSEYLQKIRLEECCRLIINTDKKIEEIITECGYIDSNYFHRIFKKKIGITPLQYRKKFSLQEKVIPKNNVSF